MRGKKKNPINFKIDQWKLHTLKNREKRKPEKMRRAPGTRGKDT